MEKRLGKTISRRHGTRNLRQLRFTFRKLKFSTDQCEEENYFENMFSPKIILRNLNTRPPQEIARQRISWIFCQTLDEVLQMFEEKIFTFSSPVSRRHLWEWHPRITMIRSAEVYDLKYPRLCVSFFPPLSLSEFPLRASNEQQKQNSLQLSLSLRVIVLCFNDQTVFQLFQTVAIFFIQN